MDLPLAQVYFPQLPTPGTALGGQNEPVGQFDLASISGAFILQLPPELVQADIRNGLRNETAKYDRKPNRILHSRF